MKRHKYNYFFGITWFVANLCVGVANDSLMKALGGSYSMAQIVFLRYLFATLSMIPFMFSRGENAFRTKHVIIHFCRAIMLSMGIAMYCFSLANLPLSTVTTVNFTMPIFSLILAFFFLKERVNTAEWIATLVGFIGIYVTFEPTHTGFSSCPIIALVVSSIMFAGLDVINKKFVLGEGILAMLFYTAIFTLLLVAMPAYNDWQKVAIADWPLFIFLGIGANLLLYCIIKSFQKVNVSTVAPFRYVEFILSVVIGFAVFHEIPALGTIIGICIIFTSTLYISLTEAKKK